MLALQRNIYRAMALEPLFSLHNTSLRDICTRHGIPFFKGHPFLQAYFTIDSHSKIHKDTTDLTDTYTVLKVLHVVPTSGTLEGGEWCQASHRAGFQLHDEDFFLFNARLKHACAEIRLTGGARRYCWGVYANTRSITTWEA